MLTARAMYKCILAVEILYVMVLVNTQLIFYLEVIAATGMSEIALLLEACLK